MPKYLLLFLFAWPLVLAGQETVEVEQKFGKMGNKEIYNVLKSDKTILHGSYKLFSGNGVLVREGFYKNGLKDSVWTEYYYGNKIMSKGVYSNHRKVGLWKFFESDGTLEQSYDYTKKELDYFKFTTQKFRIVLGTDTIVTILEQPPLYIGSHGQLGMALNENLEYPERAKQDDISGTVVITFIIDTLGKAGSHRITKRIGGGCDEESLRAVKMIPDKWIPAILNGEKVIVEYDFPVRFMLY